ncbi:glycosyltransferase family 2 protein [Candidatus Woesearchaeota archaeon]|nr:glycosyltransferase family 2 protein [Candidatus Woesearchaeota archaeon]
MKKPQISIIIPAYNEEKYIRRAINSIKRQTYSSYEIIVVANGCTDKTLDIAKRYTDKYFDVKKKSVSISKNIGSQHAAGDVLVFFDADSVMSENLLKDIKKIIEQGYIGGVCKTFGDNKKLKTRIYWWLGHLYNYLYLLPHSLTFCRKNVFKKIKGYDEKLNIAEDSTLLKKIMKQGKVKYITSSFIKTSMRGHEKKGYIKWTWDVASGFIFRSKRYKEYRVFR